MLIHGSAADHATWSIQLAGPLRDRFTLVAYDRRHGAMSVEDHAADAATLAPVIAIGSSFGAVVALELARTRPCAGIVLIEPPMAYSDEPAAASIALLAEFDRRVAEQGGPAGGELFLRTVLGDATYDRIPRAFQERSKARWAEIRADSAALVAYRPRYAELRAMTVPTLLLGGGRSAPYYRPTLDALRVVLPSARLEIVDGAGHMLHAEAPRKFAELVTGFADELGIE